MRIRPKTLAIGATSIFLSLTFIDETGVAITLPAMGRELGLSPLGLQWVMNAFFVTLAVSVLALGRLADTVGARRVFLWGLLIFVLSSIGVALATNGALLVGSRAGQGFGAAFMMATYAILLGRVFPQEEQGLALGTSASIASLFLAIGPFIGGFFSEFLSWRAIFWINLPLGLLTWVATIKAIPKDCIVDLRKRFDVAGFAAFLIGFGALILVLMQAVEWGWGSTKVAVGLGIALVGLAVFAFLQLRVAQPLADLRLFKNRAFLAGNVILMTTQVCVMALAFWAVWLQVSLGFDPLRAGLLLLPAGLPILAMGRVGGRWADRAGPQEPIRAGAILCLASMVWMALMLPRSGYAAASIGMLLYGFGAPLVISPAIKMVLTSVTSAQQGVASGMLNTMRQLGAALCFGGVGAAVNFVERDRIRSFFSGLGRSVIEPAISPPDAISLLTAGRMEPDPDFSRAMVEAAQLAYGQAAAAGMWVAVMFAAIGVLFAIFGLTKQRSSAATKVSRA